MSNNILRTKWMYNKGLKRSSLLPMQKTQLNPNRCIQTTTLTQQKQSTEHAGATEVQSQAQNDNNSFLNVLRQRDLFAQDGPKHDENMYLADPFLQRCLERLIPKDTYDSVVHPDLSRFGKRVSAEIWDLGRQCEKEPPYLAGHTDAWGKPLKNQLVTSEAWKQQKRISAEEGLIAIPYERSHIHSRLHQVAKLYMYSPASGLYSCPLAMTDGAAKIMHGMKDSHHDFKEAFQNLTSRNPSEFWTSGQWMTEKRGGSDVAGGTETIALGPEVDGSYKLHGYKWFSSATDSDMTLTLARIPDEETGDVTAGTKGISMFFARTKAPGGSKSNGITIFKLKNKLGTRQLPTGELILNETNARLVSPIGRGIASISPMLTVTRLHNVITSVGSQRKMINMARDYATRRIAFGRPISQHSLHINTLSKMEVDVRACTIFMLDLARQLGEEESGTITKEDALLLRLMMPVAKAYTAKKAVSNISEGLECFGGQGYIEDTGLPGMLRDVQVLPIWEGTTNVMALDTVRAIRKTNGEALTVFSQRIRIAVDSGMNSDNKDLKQASLTLQNCMKQFVKYCSKQEQLPLDEIFKQELALREFMFSLANLYITTLMIEHNVHYDTDKNNGGQKNTIDSIVLNNWIKQTDLIPVVNLSKLGAYDAHPNELHGLVFEGYNSDSAADCKLVR